MLLYVHIPNLLIYTVLQWQELMHHIGLYMAKGRGAKIAAQLTFHH